MSLNLSQIIPNFRRPHSQRGVIIGTTGSGKTYLAERICSFGKNVVVLDTKGLIDWKGYEYFKSSTNLKRPNDSKIFDKLIDSRKKHLVFRPSSRWLKDDGAIGEFFEWIYWRENTLLYVDEASTVTDAHYIPQGYFDCYVRGREKGISVISSTQRPTGIAKVLMTEAEHWYCFQLRNFDDTKKVYQMSGISQDTITNLDEFYFVYSNNGKLYKPQKLGKRKKL